MSSSATKISSIPHRFLTMVAFANGIRKQISSKYETPRVDGCIIDGAALVQMNNLRTSKTFREYCGIEISEKVKRMANTLETVDVMFDVYRKASRKQETREAHEGRAKNKEVRVNIKKNYPVYRKFKQVLEVSENKTELFSFIAYTLVENFQHKRETIVATKGETVVSNLHIETKYLESCKKEEADGRMFLHALDMFRLGLKKLLMVTVDTDAVVIALYAFWDL